MADISLASSLPMIQVNRVVGHAACSAQRGRRVAGVADGR